MPCVDEKVIGGVATHKDLHFAAVVDVTGRVLGTRAFATTRAGYRSLVRWMASFGRVEKVGAEQTGSYGAGIVRQLALAGIPVLEVTGPDKADRRAREEMGVKPRVAAREDVYAALGAVGDDELGVVGQEAVVYAHGRGGDSAAAP
jgi:transposase